MTRLKARYAITSTFKTIFLTPICVAAFALSVPAHAQTLRPTTYNIAPSPLAEALNTFGIQSGVKLTYGTAAVSGKSAPELKGTYDPLKALEILLQNSGLTYRRGENGEFIISQRESRNVPPSNNPTAATEARSPGPPAVDEIIVSAQKRGAERLQDVPVPVAVLQADDLSERGRVLLREYAQTVPNFTASPISFGSQALSIRGISTGGFANPTVGITIDDIPYGASSSNVGGAGVPDLDPGDLDHIEVLRGPQGTLYGANSMGGLVKYVTADPTFDRWSGRVQGGLSGIKSGGDAGYQLRGSMNAPVNDGLAVRGSAYVRSEPGYIDNIRNGDRDVNGVDAAGGKLTALWRPVDDFSLRLTALYDHSKSHGSFETTAGAGDLQQDYIPGVGGYSRRVQLYSAAVNANLGAVKLVSLTGYGINHSVSGFDWSPTFGAAVAGTWNVNGAAFYDELNMKKFSQELRVSGDFGSSIEWLIGGFYTHERNPGFEYLNAANPQTGEFVGRHWTLEYPRSFREYAVFANAAVTLTERFDVQFGARESWVKETDEPFVQSGPFIGAVPSIAPRMVGSGDAFTYLVTPRFKITPDVMVYGRAASGYRPGGPTNVVPGFPTSYKPDRTQNWEVGLKGDFLEGMLTLDTSLFYIQWKNIQIQRFVPLAVTVNANSAKSQGVELSATIRPTSRLTINAWYAYTDAVLTQNFPADASSFGVKGDRLPYASRHSGTISAEQRFDITNSTEGFVAASANFVGARVGEFTSTPARQALPAYQRFDLRAGVEIGDLSVAGYLNNATDERGLVSGGLGYIVPTRFIYIQPRTFGVTMTKKF